MEEGKSVVVVEMYEGKEEEEQQHKEHMQVVEKTKRECMGEPNSCDDCNKGHTTQTQEANPRPSGENWAT